MKKTLLFLLTIFISVVSFSQIPTGYYNGTEGKTGADLKTALFNIISSHTVLSYDALWSAYYKTDIDQFYENDGTILDIYSENPNGADPYEFIPGQDQCDSYSSEGDCYNREHSFPKSWFDDASPMYTDLFHLYPTDGKVNGMRSNYPYGEVNDDDATFISMNGSKLGPCSYPGYSGTVFEPIDEFKGDLARTYFYMATAYEDKIAGWETNTSNSDAVLNGTSYPCFEPWFLQMLLEWNDQDPVSPKEIARNDSIYKIQGNRNPYIDHPEWVHCVFENQCSGLIFTSTPVENAVINQQYTYTITYQTDDEQETFTCEQKPAWLTFSVGQANNTGTLSGIPTAAGSYDVSLKLTENGNTTYQNFTIVVTDGSEPIDLWNEDFTSCPSDWTAYSVASDKNWECSTYGYLYINAYGGDEASEDWYISPAINLNEYSDEVLSFKTYTKYSDDAIADPEVRLYYSTDYSEGDPRNATWTELNYNYPAEDSQTWTESGNIDLSSISGTNVHIAFKYVSYGTGAGSSAIWEVDDIVLQAKVNTTTSGVFNSSTGSLTGFAYILGNGPSLSQSFILYGTDLDGSAVTITAPTNYEVSLDNSSFTSVITLTDYTGSDTTIYVRLKAGREAGQYNETLNISGGGATELNITLSGQVNSAVISTSTSSISGFAYNQGSGPSDIKGFVLSGSYLDGSSVTVTAPDNFEISLDSVNFYSILTINYTAPDLQDTVIVVRLKAGLLQGIYSGDLVCADNGSAAEVSVALSAQVNETLSTCGGLENFDNLATGSSSYESGTFIGQDGSTWSYTDSRTDQSIDGASICIRDGYLLSGEIEGGIDKITISTQRVYTGTDSVLTVWINDNSIGTVPYSDLVQTTSIEDINISGNFTLKITTPGNGDRVVVDNITWTCYPTPTNTFLTASKASLTGLNYLEGNGPSEAQTVIISGSDLDGTDVTLIAPTDFELSQDATNYLGSLTLSAFDGSETTIYVRMKSGLAKGAYSNEIMKVGGGGADTILITLNGEVYSPYFNLSTENIFGFTYYLNNGPSDAKTLVLSGTGLDGTDVTIAAPADFEISQDGSTFSSSIVLSAYDGTETTIYIRMVKDLTVGVYNNESLTISGGGAETKTIGLNGEVLIPFFTASPQSLNNFNYYLNNGPSEAKTFILSGTGLDGSDVTINSPTDFEISLDGNTFTSTLTLNNFDGSPITIYTRMKADLAVGEYFAEQIEISGGSANSVFVPLYGEVYKPFLTISPTVLSGFTYMETTGPSETKTFVLAGTGVVNTDITLIAPTDYEISNDNNYSNTLDINGYNGDATTVYVRLKAGLSAGDYNNENIEISGADIETVYVTLNGSVATFTNIEQNSTSVKIYPNPSPNGFITIKTNDTKRKTVTLMDINGKTLINKTMHRETKLDLSGLSKGIYIIKISNGNWNKIEKLIIK